MASPQATPNYNALLNSFLLREYLSQLTNPRLSTDEQLDARLKLEYELDRIGLLQPTVATGMLRTIQEALAMANATEALVPAVEWYLEFVSAKDEQWHREVDVEMLARFWRNLNNAILRDRIVVVLLRVDLSRVPAEPWASTVCNIFREPSGLDTEGNLTEHGRALSELPIGGGADFARFFKRERAGSAAVWSASLALLSCCPPRESTAAYPRSDI